MVRVVFCLSVLGAVAGAQAAELLINGGFESQPNYGSGVSGDAGYSALTGNQIPGWTIAPGRAATVHNTVLYPTISGAYSVNIDGEGHNGGNCDMFQNFGANIFGDCTLSFQWKIWSVSANTQMRVSVTDTVTNTEIAFGQYTQSDFILHTEAINFIANGNPLRLRVRENPESSINDNTFIVDNFSVTNTFQTVQGTLILNNTVSPFAVGRIVGYTVKQGSVTIDSGSVVCNGPSTSITTSIVSSLNGPSTITFDGSSFLRKTQNFVLNGAVTSFGTAVLANGDVDISGEVDAADIDQVIAAFGNTDSNITDVDVSGEVDAADIDIVISNFGAVDQ